MYVKICGIVDPDQGIAIANLGANCLGFICVPTSPRYVTPDRIRAVCDRLPPGIDRVGVFLDSTVDEITAIVLESGLNGVQLHGNETPEFCSLLRSRLSNIKPNIRLIKAFRIQHRESLERVGFYTRWVDAFLLDAYDPQRAGGTGKTIDWSLLAGVQFECPWWLAGGLNPDNIGQAIDKLHPDGIDLSSGVERSPGDKDMLKVRQLFANISDIGLNGDD